MGLSWGQRFGMRSIMVKAAKRQVYYIVFLTKGSFTYIAYSRADMNCKELLNMTGGIENLERYISRHSDFLHIRKLEPSSHVLV